MTLPKPYHEEPAVTIYNCARRLEQEVSTVIAAYRSGRSGYGFEIKKGFHKAALGWIEREKSQLTLKL